MHHVLQWAVKGLRNDRLENPLAFYNLCALVGMAAQDRGGGSVWMYLCGCWVPHIAMGFPLSAARMEERQDGGKGRKSEEILVSGGLDSFSCHRPVLVTLPI